jgi:hypothetical protein
VQVCCIPFRKEFETASGDGELVLIVVHMDCKRVLIPDI